MPSSSSTEPDHGAASATFLGAAAPVVPSRPRTRRRRPKDFASFLRTQDEMDAICKEHGVPGATDLDVTAALAPSSPQTGHGGPNSKRPEEFDSFLRTQDEIDAFCKEHGVPREFTARPAGDLRANATPPPGAICVYARALEAGMRVPLDGFFCEALAHFGIAPTQLTPNGWRFLAGFLGLCRSVGVPPSLAVFRRFFLLPTVIPETTPPSPPASPPRGDGEDPRNLAAGPLPSSPPPSPLPEGAAGRSPVVAGGGEAFSSSRAVGWPLVRPLGRSLPLPAGGLAAALGFVLAAA